MVATAWTARDAAAMMRRLDVEQRHALELLAKFPEGITEHSLLLRCGFNGDLIAGLVTTGLATAQHETTGEGDKTTEVVRLIITDAGFQALVQT